MKKIAVIILCAVFMASFVAESPAASKKKKEKWVKSKGGLKSLMQFSTDRDMMEDEYHQETRTYNKAARAVNENGLRRGMSSKDVVKKIGEPIIYLKEKDGAETRWVYKKGTVDYFSSEKVYLFFDNNTNELLRWETPPVKN